MYVPFSQWLPDQFDLNNPGLEMAKNCLPGKNGFRNYPSFVRESSNAIDGDAKGMFSTKDGSGASFIFVGDDDKLYRYAPSFEFQDISRPAGYLSTDEWDFTIFDQTTIATNWSDVPQYYEIGQTTTFQDLGGAPPRAKYVATIRDFVVLGYVSDAQGEQPTRLWRSPRNAPQGPWVANPSTQCGFANIPDSGPITGLSGGAFGIALTYGGVHRLTYVGSPQVFQRDEIGNGVGCELSGSVIRRVDARGIFANLFFIGKDGFYISDGSTVSQIANDRTNEWFFGKLDNTRKQQIRGGVFASADCTIWSFPSISSTGQNDLYIAFSYANNSWAYGEIDVEILGQTDSPTRGVDDIDDLVDETTTEVDSAIWEQSSDQFGAIDHEGYFGTFVGPNLAPMFETGDMRPIRGRRSSIAEIYPDMDGVVSTAVKSGETVQSMGSYGPEQTMRRGFTSHRVDCKANNLHRVRITGDPTFTHAAGFEANITRHGN